MYHWQQQRQSTRLLTWGETVHSHHTEHKWYEWGVGSLIVAMKLKRAENHKKFAKKQPLSRWSARVGSDPSASPGMLRHLVPVWWVSWCRCPQPQPQVQGHSCWVILERGVKAFTEPLSQERERKRVCILYPSIFHPALGHISYKCQAN